MAYYTLFKKLNLKIYSKNCKKGKANMKKPTRKTVKYNFLKGVNPARFLLALYLIIPLLIIGSGFAAWVDITPSFNVNTTDSIIADRLLDTSKLAEVTAFKPYKLYYTGPVEGGQIQSNFAVDTEITLNTKNLYSLSKDCNKIMYLNLTLSLTDGSNCDIFGKETGEVWNTNFSYKFTTVSKDGLTVSDYATKITSSSYKLSLKLDFSQMGDNAIVDNLTIKPSFVLDSEGYSILFDLIKDKPDTTFRLDLKIADVVEE